MFQNNEATFHTNSTSSAALKVLERNFGLQSLETTDLRFDDLSDYFDFRQPPRTVGRIPRAAATISSANPSPTPTPTTTSPPMKRHPSNPG